MSHHYIKKNVSLLRTEDGSVTLYHHDMGASYRSTSGAVTESSHIFLKGTGLSERSGEWLVLELGFGGAINFLLTASTCLKRSDVTSLRYWTVEREPLPASLFDSAEYTEWIVEKKLLTLAKEASTQAIGQPGKWSPSSLTLQGTCLELSLFAGDWRDAPVIPSSAHAVFHDPFGPKVNTDAWSEACFRWSVSQMCPDAQLATYSAAGVVRRAMAAAGLSWRKIPGPGRKREITIASLKTTTP